MMVMVGVVMVGQAVLGDGSDSSSGLAITIDVV